MPRTYAASPFTQVEIFRQCEKSMQDGDGFEIYFSLVPSFSSS